jgi:integrase
MPRLTNRNPKYRRHRASGQAIVALNGTDHYLGPYGTKASREEYDRVIAEWHGNGRQAPTRGAGPVIVELIARYWAHAEVYYRKKDGMPTSEQSCIRRALRPLRELYGRTPVEQFGPLALEAVREKMIKSGWVRDQVNKNIHRIQRLFKWGVAKELVSASVYQALMAVEGLRAGRTAAPEGEPVKPVSDELVEAVLAFVSAQVKAMIQLQLLTGMRPGELCIMRGCDLDTSGATWVYEPGSHKTEHHGHKRQVFLGPRAQEILKPFLKADVNTYLFSPTEAEAVRRAMMHETRCATGTPLVYGNRPGTNRKARPKRRAGDCYDATSYRRAIARACEAAFPPPTDLARIKVMGKKGGKSQRWETDAEWQQRLGDRWQQVVRWREEHHWHPHQIRHTTGTRVRREFGLEAAQVILGHRHVQTTEIYAEANAAAAKRIMGAVG